VKIIAHLDMDSFYASIEERDNPQYQGLPVAVGALPNGGSGRGVVSTANYKAREYGIFSAMPISVAWRLSEEAGRQGRPRAIFLPVDMKRYAENSKRVMEIVRQVMEKEVKSAIIEQTSIDEAYLDLSFTGSYEKAESLAEKIKKDIREKEKLTCSVGIGQNKLIAKLASAKNKPDGLTAVTLSQISGFMDSIGLRDIPGIGPKTEEKLNKKGIMSISGLLKLTKDELVGMFGKWGEDIYDKARGIDESELETGRETKSISEQETFGKDTLSGLFLIEKLRKLVKEVHIRMILENIKTFKTVTITVRFFDFETKNKAHTIEMASDDRDLLEREALKLFLPFLDKRGNPKLKPLRLIGVGIENFNRKNDNNKESGKERSGQTDLFDNNQI